MRRVLRKLSIGFYILLIFAALSLAVFIRNPVRAQKAVVSTDIFAEADNLKKHVYTLADSNEYRNVENLARLNEAAAYIYDELKTYGLLPEIQSFEVNGTEFKNIVVRLGEGRPGKLLVIGAHYDVCFDTPGADDNASGVAGLLEITRILKKYEGALNRPIELAFYSLEEPPYFGGKDMGSYHHAKDLKAQKTDVELMISLEMIGRFSDQGEQKYPNFLLHFLYPGQPNFIALVGRTQEFFLTRKLKAEMLAVSDVPIYSINSPILIAGMGDSDHSSFWHHNFPAIMVTDTAYLRNFDYHTENDTANKLNYPEMAKVVTSVAAFALRF